MSKTLAMFPGQGSQYVGMGKTLLSEFPYAKEVFEEAEEALKLDLRKLCFEGPEEQLKLTENTQPTILTTSIATWKVLSSEAGLNPDYYAGHSLGEYSALVASGKMSLADAVKLVKVRGQQMQIAVPAGKGAMSAVLNLDEASLKAKCEEISSQLLSDGLDEMASSVEIANFNSAKQLIVSGGKEAVTKLGEVLTAEKVRVVSLPVSAPFHSKLMRPAREAMEPLLRDTQIIENESKVIANITGDLASPYTIENLIEQIDGPVLWTQSIEKAISLECSRFVEVGPGKVLTGLIRRAVPKGSVVLPSDDVVAAIEGLS